VIALQHPVEQVRGLAEAVVDPEMPAVTIGEMGMIRGVETDGEDSFIIRFSPTFTGCPATEIISIEIMTALARAGFDNVRIQRELAPPWSPDWISDDGREKLRKAGIAPPAPRGLSFDDATSFVPFCPHCGSPDTARQSHFGSTPCKSRHVCRACKEPFEQMKPL
jgi:ring-1,2-phenylacetyl-CoA epoxidase subunit PaaD